ncbi:hypothetical protein As57867_020845, partial [Aphanomyces stellatus]
RTTHPTLSINVICFHKPQYVALQRLCQAEPALASVDVVTVDAMQGREADVVVLSCVRTDGQVGFLSNRPRINVALSRAKEALYIVGHGPTLRSNADWRKVLAHPSVTHV